MSSWQQYARPELAFELRFQVGFRVQYTHDTSQQITHRLRNNVMSGPVNEIENRLTELEIKATYTEDLLEQLDLVVIRQQQQIDALIRELADLRQPAVESGGVTRNLRDDLPPHF